MQPFISIADLEAYTERSDLTGSDIGPILVDAACETVRGYVGQQLNLATDHVLTLDGSGTDALLLPELPVISVASVTTDDEELSADDGDYVVDLDSGILYRTFSGERAMVCWRLGYGNVEVTCDHGYAVSEAEVGDDQSTPPFEPKRMPSDIRMVALSLAQRMTNLVGSAAGITSETIGNYSYTATLAAGEGGGGLSSYEMGVLDRYRQRRQV